MSHSATTYDEVGSRTRQAWLRTCLAALGVTFLTLRGLVVAHAHVWVLSTALMPVVVILTIAVVRVRRLHHHESAGVSRATVLTLLASALALIVLGVGSVPL